MGKPLSSHHLANNEGGTAHSGAGEKKKSFRENTRGRKGEGRPGGWRPGSAASFFSGVNGASALNEVSIALFLPEAAKHAGGGGGPPPLLARLGLSLCLTADAGAYFHSRL